MLTSEFKPGDLAWMDREGHDVLVVRQASQTFPWRIVHGDEPLERYEVGLLRPAHVLAPDERAVPKGHVVLDPEAGEQVRDLAQRYNYAPGVGFVSNMQNALRAVAAEQQAAANPVPPEQVWTDGDVVQQNLCGSLPAYTAQRLRGEWWSTVVGDEAPWMQDDELTRRVKRGDLRVLRQQSTGIGCEADQ